MAKKKRKSELAKKVRARRIEMGIGLREAAEKTPMSLTAWQYLENGTNTNPTLETLKSVAKLLDCKVGELVD